MYTDISSFSCCAESYISLFCPVFRVYVFLFINLIFFHSPLFVLVLMAWRQGISGLPCLERYSSMTDLPKLNHMRISYPLYGWGGVGWGEDGYYSSSWQSKTWILTLLMLGMEYSCFGDQYHTCWWLGSLSRQGISRHGIDSIGYATCRVHWKCGLLLLNKILDMILNVNTFFYNSKNNWAC